MSLRPISSGSVVRNNFASLQVFCEPADFVLESVQASFEVILLDYLCQINHGMATLDPLSGRDGYRFLCSVKSYIEWRLVSGRQPFISWRNQPAEVGNLSHALNLINQAIASGVGRSDQEEIEHQQLVSGLGRELEAAKSQYRASLPQKKPVQAETAKKAKAA